MSLAGRQLAREATDKNDNDGDNHNSNADQSQFSPRGSQPIFSPPSSNTLLIQFTASLVAIMFYLLRQYQVPFLGLRVDLVFGIVPIECIILSTVLLALGIKDMAETLAAFYAPTHIEVDNKICANDTDAREA